MKPIIFVDVDGVLNPDDHDLPGFTVHRLTPDKVTYNVALNPAHGPLLLDLAEATGSELVWGTTWENHANTLIAPHVGLPELPWVPIPQRPMRNYRSPLVSIGAWKAHNIVNWAAGRPFVWLDDEHDAYTAVEALAAAGTVVGPHLVIDVWPEAGLHEAHLEQAREWLLELPALPTPEALPGSDEP